MQRPKPPEDIGSFDFDFSMHKEMPYDFRPDSDLKQWVWDTFLNEDSELYNQDHEHLCYYADDLIGFMWASRAFEKGGRVVLGQCEQTAIMAGGWKRKRQELQMVQWFGYIPKYIITIDVGFAETASDSDFCALIEHELYHIGCELDGDGEMYISPLSGKPKLTMRSHDVEEFHGVVQRYGASPDVQKMVELANDGPTIGKAKIAHACGTCLLKLA
ncbi:putative metallopeptidase [Acinetobacter pragensis]|uniref:putative metallopeptidase n=1 Tax=Acinetobacter pragensis TaxID=1806892 RepID=UPI003342C97E